MIRVPLNPKYCLHMGSSHNNDVPKDFSEFCSLIDIRSGSKVIKFNLYGYQKQLIQTIESNQGTVVVKGRQLGITETVSAYFLHQAILNEGFAAVVLSRTQADSSNIAKRVRRMLDSLPNVKAESDNLMRLKVAGGGEIFFRQSTPDGCRGLESIKAILFDEWAFCKEASRIFDSAVPTTAVCGDDARLIVVSTPNGKSGFYWDLLTSNDTVNLEAVIDEIRELKSDPVRVWTDSNGWAKFVCHWRAHPIYGALDDYLERMARKYKLSFETVRQEFDLSFTDASDNVFDFDLILEATKQDETKAFW